ncbi:Ig-like domain-containing protein [Archangium sp.]|uniref:Ig-like domain-containing protein n=1 Tax=Archangium sp. TaxID=1872627 RepID=UPI002D713EDC|nr:Ig-like domain-containing protein [Archangium sp.]HYO58131.1 Ig-like domain-containing protein [Archangium sp.]
MRLPVTLLVAGLVLASCEPPSEGGTAEAEPTLRTTQGELIDCNGLGPNPPEVVITSPASGATLSGTVTLTADAADDERVTRVNFLLDGKLLVSDTAPPYELVWDSTTRGNGPGVLTALAQDTRCQSTTSAPVAVTIENAGMRIGGMGALLLGGGLVQHHHDAPGARLTHHPVHQPLRGVLTSGSPEGRS